jgi:orotate phosphoribosyltransferase
VLVVDDVITAGTAIRESVDVLNAAKSILVGVAVSLDRQERASETSESSAIQQVEREVGVPVVAIVRLRHLVSYVRSEKGREKELEDIETYRKSYGVDY